MTMRNAFMSRFGRVLWLAYLIAILPNGAALGQTKSRNLLDHITRDIKIEELERKSEELERKVANLERSVRTLLDSLDWARGWGWVDLSRPTLQVIRPGYSVGQASLEQHLTGVRVRGIILNETAVAQESANFRLTIDGQHQEFFIQRLEPGSASAFEVYVPDVPLDKTRIGKFSYQGSTARYNLTR